MSKSKEIIGPDTITFENAMAQLKAIVEKLECGSLPLEESITLFEKGVALRAFCREQLDDAKLRISKIAIGEGGNVRIE